VLRVDVQINMDLTRQGVNIHLFATVNAIYEIGTEQKEDRQLFEFSNINYDTRSKQEYILISTLKVLILSRI